MEDRRSLVAVVDDEEPVRRALLRLLRAADMQVEAFASGESFLASLERFHPDCVVLDLQMPGLTIAQQGFDVTYTPSNNHYVAAEGTVAQADSAFGTTIKTYAVNGRRVRSPSGDVSIPSSLAGVVTGVVGLDDSATFVGPDAVADGNAPPSEGFRNAPPLSDFWAQKLSPYAFPSGFTVLGLRSVQWTVRGYTPQQITAMTIVATIEMRICVVNSDANDRFIGITRNQAR